MIPPKVSSIIAEVLSFIWSELADVLFPLSRTFGDTAAILPVCLAATLHWGEIGCDTAGTGEALQRQEIHVGHVAHSLLRLSSCTIALFTYL